MATVNKDFKVKNGLIVEGANGTINGYDILTKDSEDQAYIVGLIGGSANSEAVANAVVIRDQFANFAANVITSDLIGDVTGTVSDISNHNTDSLDEGSSYQRHKFYRHRYWHLSGKCVLCPIFRSHTPSRHR